jgi:hypothetical protein
MYVEIKFILLETYIKNFANLPNLSHILSASQVRICRLNAEKRLSIGTFFAGVSKLSHFVVHAY